MHICSRRRVSCAIMLLAVVEAMFNMPYQKMEAENDDSTGETVDTVICPNGEVVYSTSLVMNVNQLYKSVYFGYDAGPEEVTFAVSAGTYSGNYSTCIGSLDLHLDDVESPPVASLVLRCTHECPYKTVSTFIPTVFNGFHDLYVRLTTADPYFYVRIDWFAFTESKINATGLTDKIKPGSAIGKTN